MTKKPEYKSDAFEAIDSNVEGMLPVGTIDKAPMRRFDEVSLTRGSALDTAQAHLRRERGGADKSDSI